MCLFCIWELRTIVCLSQSIEMFTLAYFHDFAGKAAETTILVVKQQGVHALTLSLHRVIAVIFHLKDRETPYGAEAKFRQELYRGLASLPLFSGQLGTEGK